MWGVVYVADYKSLYSQRLDYKSSRTKQIQQNKGLKQKRFPHLSEESVPNDMYKNE